MNQEFKELRDIIETIKDESTKKNALEKLINLENRKIKSNDQ